MKQKSGHTIIELMVASGLLLLLTGLLLTIFSSTRQRLDKMEVLIKLEEDVINALSLLVDDLGETNIHALETSGTAFAVFPLPRTPTGTLTTAANGELRWSTLVAYRSETINGEPVLIRQVEDVPDSDGEAILPSDLAPPADLAFFDSGIGPKKKIADGFQSLSIEKKR